MTALVPPDVRLHHSWAEAVAEFGEEAMHGSGLWTIDRTDLSVAALAGHVEALLRQADLAVEPAEGMVRCTYSWIVDGEPGAGEPRETFVGYLALRHELNDFLLREGGHIGYAVRPSRRRQGHASRALALALDQARALGLDRVLLTCDTDNDASRAVIEGAGGVLDDVRGTKRRYWIELSSGR